MPYPVPTVHQNSARLWVGLATGEYWAATFPPRCCLLRALRPLTASPAQISQVPRSLSPYSPFQRPIHAQRHVFLLCPTVSMFPFFLFHYLSTLWVSAVPGGGEEAKERRTRRARKGFDPSGGDPAHHPSRMPHPSYRSSFSEKEQLNSCSLYADLAPVCTLCSSHLQPLEGTALTRRGSLGPAILQYF